MARPIFRLGAILLAALASSVRAQAVPDAETLTPPELAALRGGFQLPGGLSVTIGATTSTSIDGREVLRSTFNLRDAAPGVTVLAQRPDGSGIAPLTAVVNGVGVATREGVVRLRSGPEGVRVDLAGDAIDVSHLLGGALGSVIANSGNDRSIDVTTSIDIGLGGITPDAVGSSAIRVENLALDATSRMIR